MESRLAAVTKAATALASLILAVMGLISIFAGNPAGVTTDTQTVVDKAAPATPTQVAQAPPAGELQVTPEEAEELRDNTPDDVPAEKLEAAEDAEEAVAEQLDLPDHPLPVAGAQGYSCRRMIQSRGFGGFRTYVFGPKLHYTVSPNIPNSWQDILNVRRYLEDVGLSANVIMDFDGKCAQTVDYDRCPYTQGAFNCTSESVEIIATGKETMQEWAESKLIKNGILASWVRDRLDARKLPHRFVDPVGCQDKPGYTDHNHLECGNNHVDVSPNFPFTLFQRQVQFGLCNALCQRARELRGKHKRTHARFRKRDCAKHQGPGYCERLRNRNRAVHIAAKREGISLAGTYR